MYPAPAACWSPSSQQRGQCRPSLKYREQYRHVKWLRERIRPGTVDPLERRWWSAQQRHRLAGAASIEQQGKGGPSLPVNHIAETCCL